MDGQLVFVALGANLGDAVSTLRRARERLKLLSQSAFSSSSIYRSSPDNCPKGSPDFYNAVVAFAPLAGETPESLLAKLQQLEKEFGRQPKTVINEPRTLDLDLIVYGEERRQTPELVPPHPRAHLRRFVVEPMAEIAPNFKLPASELSVSEIARGLRAQSLWRVA